MTYSSENIRPLYLTRHRTERLVLRPLTAEDALAWEPFFTDAATLQFFNFNPEQTPRQKADFWINWQLKRYAENRFGLLALEEISTGALAGMAGLLSQEADGNPELEIGYHVLPQFRGKGYAAEAARFFRDFAWQHQLSPSLVSIIHEDNLPSQRVAEKNGMLRGPKTTFEDEPVYFYRLARP